MSKLYEAIRCSGEGNSSTVILTFLNAALQESAYTYERLQHEAERISARLATLNLAVEFPLAILFRSQEEQTLHYLAALGLGLRPAILTPPNRKFHRKYYLETMHAILQSGCFSAVLTDVPELAMARSEQTANRLLPDTALVQFSSGTTGIKRGVEISHNAVLRQIDTYSRAIGLSREDRIISWLPLYHDMGFMTALNMALVCGVPCIMMEPSDWVGDPGMYCRAVSRYRGTLGWNPNFAYPFMAERVKESDLTDLDLSSLRGLVNCSEPVTEESQSRFRRRFAQYGLANNVFWGCYAMAETTFALTHGGANDTSVGQPLEGVELAIDDTGELRVKSPFTFSRYYNNPEATAAAFQDGWYKTGDLGYRISDNFFVSGRKKDLLLVAGEKYFPEDLERAVSCIPGIHPGRVCAFAQFLRASQSDRAVILAETSTNVPSLLLAVRQVVASRFQFSQFDVHLVPPGWLIKSSAGKMARGLNREKWISEQP
jgi:fatty-acyl-CoA synthase